MTSIIDEGTDAYGRLLRGVVRRIGLSHPPDGTSDGA
jgi:hypothetical protein